MSERESRQKWFTIGIALSLSAATFAKPMARNMDEPWPEHESPRLVAKPNYRLPQDLSETRRFSKRVTNVPWTGAFYPTHSGGIAVRARTEVRTTGGRNGSSVWPTGLDANAFHYEFYTVAELAAMDVNQAKRVIANLSSAEKLDLIAGNAEVSPSSSRFYRHTRQMRADAESVIRNHPEQLGYHGLCGGVSAASIALPEPKRYVIPYRYRLADGAEGTLPVEFGSDDFKANAAQFYADKLWNTDDYFTGNIGSNRTYGDLNAGSFHVLLMSIVGRDGESFGVDTGPGAEVWNYAVVGFRTSVFPRGPVRTRGASREATHEVEVETDVDYMGNSDPNALPQGLRSERNILTKTYRYRLELAEDDRGHRVVGGSWLAGSEHVDFAWKLKAPIPFEGDYGAMAPYWVEQPRE